MLATVHIRWGEKKADPEGRIEEIGQVVQFLKKRTLDETAWARNLILLGDFNIWKPRNKTFKELENAEFIIPKQLQGLPSTAKKNRHYDQIAFRVRPGSLTLTEKKDGEDNAGVFDFYQSVYRKEDRREQHSLAFSHVPSPLPPAVSGGKIPSTRSASFNTAITASASSF